MSRNVFMYIIIILGFCAAPVGAEQILNLPRAVRDSCAIVRGRPVYLAASSFYDRKEGYELERDNIWSIDVTGVYRWKLPSWRVDGQLRTPPDYVPRRLIFVDPGVKAILKYNNEVVIFLKCGCRDGYTFTKMGWPLRIGEDERDGVKSKFIRGWSIMGLGAGKIPLEDFAMAIKREEKKRTKPQESLGRPAFEIID